LKKFKGFDRHEKAKRRIKAARNADESVGAMNRLEALGQAFRLHQ
jgi:hypothetical protein